MTEDEKKIVVCIEQTIRMIEFRLAAKQPMYQPDAEWDRLFACAESLRNARRLIEV